MVLHGVPVGKTPHERLAEESFTDMGYAKAKLGADATATHRLKGTGGPGSEVLPETNITVMRI